MRSETASAQAPSRFDTRAIAGSALGKFDLELIRSLGAVGSLEPAPATQSRQLAGRGTGAHASPPPRPPPVELAAGFEHKSAAPSGHLPVNKLEPDESRDAI